MSKRSDWCEFNREVRRYIKARDKNKCVICGASGSTQIMHVFVSRAKGGKGDKRNGCLGCLKCHQIMDNPIGAKDNELSKIYLAKCQEYLINIECITDIEELKKELVYNKKRVIINFEEIEQSLKPKVERCKHCKFLLKKTTSNSSISSYYCKYRKINISKNSQRCKYFKSY